MKELFNKTFFWLQANLSFFQYLSFIISGILLWLIIYLIARMNFIGEKTKYFFDVLENVALSRRRSLKIWKQIQKRLKIGGESNLKMAIIEADKILDEVLKKSGYQGENMSERLKQVAAAQLSNIQEIWQVHKIRNRIVHEPDFKISRGETEAAIKIYKKAFQEFGLID